MRWGEYVPPYLGGHKLNSELPWKAAILAEIFHGFQQVTAEKYLDGTK
jgi:hypothetical protein